MRTKSVKNMKKEELEVLSYTDLTEMILKENHEGVNSEKELIKQNK